MIEIYQSCIANTRRMRMARGNCIDQVRPTARFTELDRYSEELSIIADRVERLAHVLISLEEKITSAQYPFDHAQMLILWGLPGRGKTYLIEALINEIKDKAPNMLRMIYLARSDFTLDNIALPFDYDRKPIVIIDDLFAKYQAVHDLHPRTDIVCFMRFVQMIYEERRMVIATCNFPFKEGILERVKTVDTIGRIVSRMKELLANSGEIEIIGIDYRDILSQKNEGIIQF